MEFLEEFPEKILDDYRKIRLGVLPSVNVCINFRYISNLALFFLKKSSRAFEISFSYILIRISLKKPDTIVFQIANRNGND